MAKKKSLFDQREEKRAVAIVVHCAHDLCEYPSICSIKLKTGRTNLCRFHYDQHFQIQADRNNDVKGMQTADRMRAFCREQFKERRVPGTWWKVQALAKIASGESVGVAAYELATSGTKRVVERQPGEDDE